MPALQLIALETTTPQLRAPASGDTYSAAIPGSAAPTGALVRWYVRATDSQGGATRDPPFAQPDQRQYWGTIVADADDQSSLPIMEL